MIESAYVTMTYRDIATHLNISYNAAIQRVKRNKEWMTFSDNKKRVTVKIPRDKWQREIERVTNNNTGDKHHVVTKNDTSDGSSDSIMTKAYENERSERLALADKCEDLTKRLAHLEGRQDALLKEKQRLSNGNDKLQSQLKETSNELDRLKEEHDKVLNRSWWKRLFNIQ